MTSPLAVTVGYAPSGPVDVALTDERPHLRWAGAKGTGKTTQLRSAVRQLVRQVPATERLRLVFFTADSTAVPQLEGIGGGDRKDPNVAAGVLVVPLDSSTAGVVASIRSEIARRRESPDTPPLIIAVDDVDELNNRRGLLHRRPGAAVQALINDLDEWGHTPPGIHLLLASSRLSDFGEPTWPEERNARSPYTTIILPLTAADAARHASLLTALRDCGALSDTPQHDCATREPRRFGYRLSGGRAIRFTLAPPQGPVPTAELETAIPYAQSEVGGYPVTPDGAIAAASNAGWRIVENTHGCVDRCLFISDASHSYVGLRWWWPGTVERPNPGERQLVDYASVGSTIDHNGRFLISSEQGFTAEEQMAWLLGIFTCLGLPSWGPGLRPGIAADRPASAQPHHEPTATVDLARQCPTPGGY